MQGHKLNLLITTRFGNFSYIIGDLPAGNYFVDLHFAEIVFTNDPPGMRVFDVFVQENKERLLKSTLTCIVISSMVSNFDKFSLNEIIFADSF